MPDKWESVGPWVVAGLALYLGQLVIQRCFEERKPQHDRDAAYAEGFAQGFAAGAAAAGADA